MSFIKSVPSPLSRVHRSINRHSKGFASLQVDTMVRAPYESNGGPDEIFFASQNDDNITKDECLVQPTGNNDELAVLKEANHRLAAELCKYQAHAKAAYLAENSACGGIALFGRHKHISNLRQRLIESSESLEAIQNELETWKTKHHTVATLLANSNRELEEIKKEVEDIRIKLTEKTKEIAKVVKDAEEVKTTIKILEQLNADKDLLIEDGKAKVIALEAIVEYWNTKSAVSSPSIVAKIPPAKSPTGKTFAIEEEDNIGVSVPSPTAASSPSKTIAAPPKTTAACTVTKKTVEFDVNPEILPERKVLYLPLTPMPSSASNKHNTTPLSLLKSVGNGIRRSARKPIRTVFFSPDKA